MCCDFVSETVIVISKLVRGCRVCQVLFVMKPDCRDRQTGDVIRKTRVKFDKVAVSVEPRSKSYIPELRRESSASQIVISPQSNSIRPVTISFLQQLDPEGGYPVRGCTSRLQGRHAKKLETVNFMAGLVR